MVTVFLVDDHEVVRRGLADLLASDPDLEVIGDAGSVSEAMVRIPALKPDVAVLDGVFPTATASNCAATGCLSSQNCGV
jgi:two-component system response regulator DevR